jgi:hypothetical protein
MNKAPAGGMTSSVNGQRYEGGEFMPEHGYYCGKGKNRATREEFEAIAARAAAAGRTLSFDESSQTFIVKIATGNIEFRVKSLRSLAKCYR